MAGFKKGAAKTRKEARKSDDGTFTTKKFAKEHPKTTEVETIPNRKPAKTKKK